MWVTVTSLFSKSLTAGEDFQPGELDSLHWKIDTFKEEDRKSLSKIHNLKHELDHFDNDIIVCKEKSKMGKNDIDVLNEEVDGAEKKKEACETTRDLMTKKVTKVKRDMPLVEKNIVRMKGDLVNINSISCPVSTSSVLASFSCRAMARAVAP